MEKEPIVFYDVHTHLDKLKSFEPACVDKEVSLALENNIERMITIGTGPEDNEAVLNIAKKHGPNVYCSLGMHPHDAKDFTTDVDAFVIGNLSEKEVVAVGEIGLDFYYDHSPEDVQMEVFDHFMSMAEKHDLPVEIHTREAEKETVEVLKKYQGKVQGIIHCFSGTEYLATEALKAGFDLSISGIVSFKNAKEIREVVKSTPLERIHLETDSPFLAPVPHRGKSNRSHWVYHVAEVVAQLHDVSLEHLSRQSRDNAHRLFKKLK